MQDVRVPAVRFVFVFFFGFEETWLRFNICMTPSMCLCLCLSLSLCLWKPSWCSLFMWHHLCLSCPSQQGAKPDGPTLIAFENYIENYEGKLYWRNLSENYSAGSSWKYWKWIGKQYNFEHCKLISVMWFWALLIKGCPLKQFERTNIEKIKPPHIEFGLTELPPVCQRVPSKLPGDTTVHVHT